MSAETAFVKQQEAMERVIAAEQNSDVIRTYEQ